MQSQDRTKAAKLQPSRTQLIVFSAEHMTADIMTPPTVSDIASGSSKFWLESKRIPCHDCIA
jgi:hypothetical protein